MNIIEIHLILNHIPILGVAFVSLYLLIATIFKNAFLQKVSLWILLCVALLTIAVYLSGLGAETPVKSLPNVSNAYLQLHEKVARIASVTIWAIGGITLAERRGQANSENRTVSSLDGNKEQGNVCCKDIYLP